MLTNALLVLLAFSSAVLAVRQPVPPNQPSFCNGINCPQYTVLKNYSTFEIRQYQTQQFVSTTYEGPTAEYYNLVGNLSFNRLFGYISGANSAGASIDMTAPVTTDVVPGAGPNCNTSFTVSFFIPYKYQGVAPTPTDPNVFLQYRMPANSSIVAVRSFGKFATNWETEVKPEFRALGEALQSNGIKFTQQVETVAQYDGPFQLFNRHNEVWYYLTDYTH